MATAFAPVGDTKENFTVVTQLVPTQAAPTGTVLNVPAAPPAASTPNPWRKFLKGEPKALGIVQIMIGVIMLLVGSVTIVHIHLFAAFSGITVWGSIIYISTGSLAVAAERNSSPCVVKSSLVMNVFSAVTAVIAIALLSIEIIIADHDCYANDHTTWGYCRQVKFKYYYIGVTGVLLVLSVLQFIISIWISAFACKACCGTQPTVYIVVNNPTVPNYSITNPPPYNYNYNV